MVSVIDVAREIDSKSTVAQIIADLDEYAFRLQLQGHTDRAAGVEDAVRLLRDFAGIGKQKASTCDNCETLGKYVFSLEEKISRALNELE